MRLMLIYNVIKLSIFHVKGVSLLKIYCKLIYDYGSLYIVVPNRIEHLYKKRLKVLYIKPEALRIK